MRLVLTPSSSENCSRHCVGEKWGWRDFAKAILYFLFVTNFRDVKDLK